MSLKEIQQAIAAMLADFDSLCSEQSISYTLAYGSVLGAVRHCNFIPWDDDLDLYVLRSDYERLEDLLVDGSIDYCRKYAFISERNSKCPFLKILSKSVGADDVAMAAYDDIGINGLWIDVFPLDFLSTDRATRKQQFSHSRHLQNLYFYSRMRDNSQTQSMTGRAKRILARSIGTKRIVHMIDAYARKLDSDTGIVGDLVWGVSEDEMQADEILKPAYVQFGDRTYPVPQHYKDYLTKVYGNYMELPPVEQRINHGLKCWHKDA